MLKECKTCGEEKEIDEFHIAVKGKPYRRGSCKVCHRKGMKVYANNPPARLSKRDASRKARKINHAKLLDYIGGAYVCSTCGYTNESSKPFDFHHIDMSTKEQGVGRMMQLSWSRIKEEVDKCIVLCSNCHRLVDHNE